MATTGTSSGTATKHPKTVSRNKPERSATTGTDGDDRPERRQREEGGRRGPPMSRSKSLREDFGTAGERGKIDPTGPSPERGLSSPLKRLSGITDRLGTGSGVCKITHHEQRGGHQATGTGGLGPRGRQGRSRQVQAPRQVGPCGRAAPAQGPRAGHLAQHFPAGGLGVGLRCCIPCTCTPATRATPTA